MMMGEILRHGRSMGLIIICWLGASGCAALSGGLALGYKPDDVDDFHADAVALKDDVAKISEDLASIRGRLGAVARGQATPASVTSDIRRFQQLAGTIKTVPGKVGSLLSSGKQMLTNAPTRYAGPQAIYLPKKVKLIKEALTTLTELPAQCKTLAVETASLGRCVAGLPRGDTSACSTDGTAVASTTAGSGARAAGSGEGVMSIPGLKSTAKKPAKEGTAGSGESSMELKSMVHPCSMVALSDPQWGLAGLQSVSPVALSRNGTLHFRSTAQNMSLRLKIGARVRTVKVPAVIRAPSFTTVKFSAATPGLLPVLGQVVSLPGRIRTVQLPTEIAGAVLSVPYERTKAHPVYVDGKKAGQTPFLTCLKPGRVYQIRVGRALGPFSVYAKVGGRITLNKKALLERAISISSMPGEESSGSRPQTARKEKADEGEWITPDWVRLPPAGKESSGSRPQPARKEKADEGEWITPDWARSPPADKPPRPSSARLSLTQLKRGLRAIWHIVQNCHKHRRNRGWYKIEFTIDGRSGKVKRARALESAGDPRTGECLRAAVMKARFTTFGDKPKTIIYPFDFR